MKCIQPVITKVPYDDEEIDEENDIEILRDQLTVICNNFSANVRDQKIEEL